jgi:hypothetical protein
MYVSSDGFETFWRSWLRTLPLILFSFYLSSLHSKAMLSVCAIRFLSVADILKARIVALSPLYMSTPRLGNEKRRGRCDPALSPLPKTFLKVSAYGTCLLHINCKQATWTAFFFEQISRSYSFIVKSRVNKTHKVDMFIYIF